MIHYHNDYHNHYHNDYDNDYVGTISKSIFNHHIS